MTLDDLVNQGGAAVRGFGNSALLGLQKYPAAALMAAASKISGETGLPLKDAFKLALETINDQQTNDRQEYRAASTLGELAGLAVPGVNAARAVTNISRLVPGTAGRVLTAGGAGAVGAGQGAIAGFNERQDLGDAALGAGAAALGGVVGQTGQAAVIRYQRHLAAQGARETVENASMKALELREAMSRAKKVGDRRLEASLRKSYDDQNEIEKQARRNLWTLMNKKRSDQDALNTPVFRSADDMRRFWAANRGRGADVDVPKGTPMPQSARRALLPQAVRQSGIDLAQQSTLGAGAGTLAALATGQDPLTGALLGGAGLPTVMRFKGAASARLPPGALAAAGIQAGKAAPVLSAGFGQQTQAQPQGVQRAMEPEVMFDPWEDQGSPSGSASTPGPAPVEKDPWE